MNREDQAAPIAGLETRAAALDILMLVRGGRSLDAALQACRSFDALEGRDRAFARALATMVLRRQGAIDEIVGGYIDKPLPKRAARVMEILRIAAAQSALLDTPDHAAVSTAVALTKTFKEAQGYAGLVNAVARKITRTGKTAIEKLPPRIDTPGWLWRSWERAYGPAGARAIASAHLREPPLDLTPKDPAAVQTLASATGGVVLPTGSVRLSDWGRVEDLPAYEAGEWWVQDAAAAIPARLCGDVRGMRVFDLCAAPGGKTLQLAAAGAEVTAVDIEGHRLKLVADNLERTRLRAETVKADILKWRPDGKADVVLLDAPCTATGTIRRHPDILRNRKEDDVAVLARLQAQMIDHAVEHCLKPGALLVYSVCSLQPEEGERQIEQALGRFAQLSREPVTSDEIGVAAVNAVGDMRTTPVMLAEAGGMDGFYAARLRFAG